MFYLGASFLTAAISCIKQLRKSMPSAVSERSPYLLVTIVNLSDSHRLKLESSWFQSGRIWSPQPFDSILPLSSITVFACSNDSAIATGVSGGIGLRVYQNGGSARLKVKTGGSARSRPMAMAAPSNAWRDGRTMAYLHCGKRCRKLITLTILSADAIRRMLITWSLHGRVHHRIGECHSHSYPSSTDLAENAYPKQHQRIAVFFMSAMSDALLSICTLFYLLLYAELGFSSVMKGLLCSMLFCLSFFVLGLIASADLGGICLLKLCHSCWTLYLYNLFITI